MSAITEQEKTRVPSLVASLHLPPGTRSPAPDLRSSRWWQLALQVSGALSTCIEVAQARR